MYEWQSKKWVLFVTRPSALLKREFIKQVYFYIDAVSCLKISRLMIIGGLESNLVFVRKKEDERNALIVGKEFKQKKVEKQLENFKKIIKNFKPSGRDEINSTLSVFKTVGPILIYTYYLERILTKKFQNYRQLPAPEKRRWNNLMKQNEKFRDGVARIIYPAFAKAYPILKSKFKRTRDIDYYTLPELKSQKKLLVNEISQRKNFYVEITDRNQAQIYTGKKAIRILRDEGFTKKKIPKTKVLKGVVASSGFAKGKVVIIKKLSDFKKPYKSRIVVSPMTIIDFDPYFKKVKAIVNDIGGINGHAAIISRELKIPCLVNTRIAAKVFKDGDLALVIISNFSAINSTSPVGIFLLTILVGRFLISPSRQTTYSERRLSANLCNFSF